MKGQGADTQLDDDRIWTGYRTNATSGVWMGGLRRAPSVQALQTAPARRLELTGSDPAETTSDTATASRQRAAADFCSSDGSGEMMYAQGASPDQPPTSEELRIELAGLVEDVDEELGDIAPYAQCMRSEGVDYSAGSDGRQGWHGLYLHLTAMMPVPPLPTQKPEAAWLAYLETERMALEADATCRRDRYEEGLRLLDPLLQDFEAEHQDDLAQLDVLWADVVARAAAAGLERQ